MTASIPQKPSRCDLGLIAFPPPAAASSSSARFAFFDLDRTSPHSTCVFCFPLSLASDIPCFPNTRRGNIASFSLFLFLITFLASIASFVLFRRLLYQISSSTRASLFHKTPVTPEHGVWICGKERLDTIGSISLALPGGGQLHERRWLRTHDRSGFCIRFQFWTIFKERLRFRWQQASYSRRVLRPIEKRALQG